MRNTASGEFGGTQNTLSPGILIKSTSQNGGNDAKSNNSVICDITRNGYCGNDELLVNLSTVFKTEDDVRGFIKLLNQALSGMINQNSNFVIKGENGKEINGLADLLGKKSIIVHRDVAMALSKGLIEGMRGEFSPYLPEKEVDGHLTGAKINNNGSNVKIELKKPIGTLEDFFDLCREIHGDGFSGLEIFTFLGSNGTNPIRINQNNYAAVVIGKIHFAYKVNTNPTH